MARRSKIDKTTKLNRDIARWEHKQEGAVIMLRKSAEMLVKLRRQRHRMLERETRRRLDEPTSRELARATDSAPAAAPVESTVPLAKLGETAIGKANAESWNAIPAVAKAKPETEAIRSNDPDLVAKVETALAGPKPPVDDGIPANLRRAPREFDPYKGERDAATKEKAKIKREANKQRAAADATGERAKMPLTGKAALAAIRKRKRISTLADAQGS